MRATRRAPRRGYRWFASLVGLGSLLSLASSAAAQSWTYKGAVVQGEQVDAVAANGKVHVVTNRYYQFDKDANVVVSETGGDPFQDLLWAFMFSPALAVAPDGTVHVAVRERNGDAGHDGLLNIWYKRRSAAGAWSSGYLYSAPAKANWNVGVADDGAGHVHMLSSNHGGGGSVWADLRLYTDSGGTSATSAGTLSDVFRVDYEARLRARGGRVYFASGNSFLTSSAYFSYATGGAADLSTQLKTNMQKLSSGSGKDRGFPDMAFDGQGNVHFTYGSGYTDHNNFPASTAGCVQGEVHYNKFSNAGQKLFATDRTIFTNLGVWHLSIGLSAVAASDDGKTVLAVALRSPNHKEAGNSELLWSVSTNGGETWSTPQVMADKTFGGEGRQRPRLVALGSKFFLFYKKNGTLNTHLATIAFPETDETPSGLSASALGSSAIKVCWQDRSTGEEAFLVERKSNAGFAQVASLAANATCYDDSGLSPETVYTYRVRYARGGSYSAYSGEASATTTAVGVVVPDGGQGGPDGDAAPSGGGDAAFYEAPSLFGPGCGCRAGGARGGSWGLAAVIFAWILSRRARR